LRCFLWLNIVTLSISKEERNREYKICLKEIFEDVYSTKWYKQDLSKKHYVYIWVDGIYFNICLDNDRQCILVMIGATVNGKKELIAVEDGYRESKESWQTLLRDLKTRGLSVSPSIATGDGALGFWATVVKNGPI